MNLSKVLFNEDLSKLLLRVATGGLMLFHGIHKAMYGGFQGMSELLIAKGLPGFLWIGVPVAEIIAPILLILGIFGRISALLIVSVMLFAMYLVFGIASFSLTEHGGLLAELNIFFVFAGLALFFSGSGKYALYKGKNEWLK